MVSIVVHKDLSKDLCKLQGIGCGRRKYQRVQELNCPTLMLSYTQCNKCGLVMTIVYMFNINIALIASYM